jgi:hypothetical protein
MANNKRTPVFTMDSVPIKSIMGNRATKLVAQLRQQQNVDKSIQVNQPVASLNNKAKK